MKIFHFFWYCVLALSFFVFVSGSTNLIDFPKNSEEKLSKLDLAAADLIEAHREFKASCHEFHALRASQPPKPHLSDLLFDFSVYQFFLLTAATVIRSCKNSNTPTMDLLDIISLIFVNDVIVCLLIFAYEIEAF